MLITGALLVNLVYNPPTFNTDLDAFTPDSEASKAHDRIHQNFPNESRPMFVNVESDNGGNVLTIENIKLMLQHYQALVNLSSSNDDSVVVLDHNSKYTTDCSRRRGKSNSTINDSKLE